MSANLSTMDLISCWVMRERSPGRSSRGVSASDAEGGDRIEVAQVLRGEAVAGTATRRTPGPGYANRLQHADDLGPPSHNLTVRLHPVQVRMQQRLERAPITLDECGMRA